MAMGSSEDFSGGYDHKKRAGLILLADHHIAPGKKQWTWGNHKFGYAWDRNLTDEDGPYIELMTGVFTDNQPDFSFLDPGETKVFSQYWYPIRDIGPAQMANLDAAASLVIEKGIARVGVCATRDFPGATVRLEVNAGCVAEWKRDLAIGAALVEQVVTPAAARGEDFTLVVLDKNALEILRYQPAAPAENPILPAAATEPPLPAEVGSNDELYVIGLHLDQYRHATRHPEIYWREALRRDAGDSRCNNAMGLWHLRRGEFAEAERYLRAAIDRLTTRNANPYDEEPHYNLGLTLRYLGRDRDAYDAFYKATWSGNWQAAAFQQLAEIDGSLGDWAKAADHALISLRKDADNLQVRNLAAIALRKAGRSEDAGRILDETRALDPLDIGGRYLASGEVPADAQMALDLAFDLARVGLVSEAIAILEHTARVPTGDGSTPMLLYTLAAFRAKNGDATGEDCAWIEGAGASPDYCFPNRLEEMLVLEAAIAARPKDARAPYYLGNLLYARRRHKDAIAMWERAAHLDPAFSISWRNLGIAYFNVVKDTAKARDAFDRAFNANPADSRVLYERDQLWKRIGERPEVRLAELERHLDLANSRDDLSVELASLYNQTCQHEKALAIVRSRHFQPWEGGEGLALGQHVRTHLALGRHALQQGHLAEARCLFEAALHAPENLGEAKHPLSNQSDIYYWHGVALDASGDSSAAREAWELAATHRGDFQLMRVTSFSELSYYNALALLRIVRTKDASDLLQRLLEFAVALRTEEPKVDYFATSLPQMLLFEDDARRRNAVRADFLEAQARIGLGEIAAGRKLLARVLGADPNNPHAADLLAELELQSPAAHSQRS
jgi:tetratricopeptide (TPR) repeat protein